MNKNQKENTKSPSKKELLSEIAVLRQEIRQLNQPFYRIQEAFRKINEMLGEVIPDDFVYWVHLDKDGGIKVDFMWDNPGGSQIEILDTSLDVILGLLGRIDWDTERENQLEATEQYYRLYPELKPSKSPGPVASLIN